jgi:hypothetical protein
MTVEKTGLLSTIVGAFIIEFYKKLSPDNAGQTVDLLCQISKQLPNFPNGSCTTSPIPSSFSPPASIVWINALWMMSLLLSLTSALFATLLQQWARKYLQAPKIPSEPKQCARVRSFLFLGTQQHHMYIAVETAPTLLHLSVFLFFAGLVILFYTIHKTVAIIVSISIGIFVAAYVALTIFPCVRPNCPYRTPMSIILWYTSHGFLRWLFLCLYGILELLHCCCVSPNEGETNSWLQSILVSGLQWVEDAVNKHKQRLKDGFRENILRWAGKAADIVDVKALTWWFKLPALAEESKAQDFFACIPKEMIIRLMHDRASKDVVKEHLLTLLRSCGSGSLAIGLDESECKARLLVCLQAINHTAQDCAKQNPHIDVDFMRINFANIGLMRDMWADSDTGICVTSRSICALLARRLILLGRERDLEEGELRWLQDVTGTSSRTIFHADSVDRDLINLKAFVYGVLANRDLLQAEHVPFFTYTLAILMDAGTETPFNRPRFQTQLSTLLEQIEGDTTTPHRTEVAERLRLIFNFLLPAPAP